MRSLVSSGVSWPKSSKDMEHTVDEVLDEAIARPGDTVVKADAVASNAQAINAMRRVLSE